MILDYDIPSTNMTPEQVGDLSSMQNANQMQAAQYNMQNANMPVPKPQVTGGESLSND